MCDDQHFRLVHFKPFLAFSAHKHVSELHKWKWHDVANFSRSTCVITCFCLANERSQGLFTIYAQNPEISDGLEIERMKSLREEIFSGKRYFLKGRPNFPHGKCAFHLLVFYWFQVMFDLDIAFDPIFREKGTHTRQWKFYLGFKASHFSTTTLTVEQLVFPSEW